MRNLEVSYEYKCIALDLDRTTLNASGRLSDGNYNALCHAIEMVFTL